MQQFRRSYRELLRLPTFIERYRYLRLQGHVGIDTFGHNRYLNQVLYSSPEWKRFRKEILVRDNGYDLGCEDREIKGIIVIHHINPLTIEDVERQSPVIFDPNNVISCADITHKAIHYGDENLLPKDLIERKPGDHCPWL